MQKRVLVALSGGIDSTVAAYLLKESGYDVAAITMSFNIKTSPDEGLHCWKNNTIEDSKRICDKLNIPHYVIDCSEELEDKVIARFVFEYSKGRTPNPCVDCNRFLKFGILLEKALSLGFDYLATGHYAKIDRTNQAIFLKKAKDKTKDQSYFLYQINKDKLKNIIFPLADLTKEEVRQIAKDIDLAIANKSQSQDICFIQDDYRKFLSERIKSPSSGEIVNKDGKILGRHKGIFFYTIGQRQKLGISYPYPLYVIAIDQKSNRVIVGKEEDLFAKGLIATDINILVDKLPEKATAKIRYQHKEASCFLYQEGQKIKVLFEEKQPAITPGQSVVLYQDEIVLGGGIIEEVIW